MTLLVLVLRPMLDRARLVGMGFSGFLTIKHLRQTDLAELPTGPGVYVVLRDELTQPNFVSIGTGGRFKGRDPNVPLETLEEKWVDDACVIYIGKAEPAHGEPADLGSAWPSTSSSAGMVRSDIGEGGICGNWAKRRACSRPGGAPINPGQMSRNSSRSSWLSMVAYRSRI